VTDFTLAGLADAIRAKTISAIEATQGYLDRIARLDPTIRSFITVDGDGALAAARALDAEAAAGRWRGPLHGVPLAYKELCHIPGLPTSCGTKTPEYFRGPHECTAVRRLREAGAITLGKLNMSELALGPFGDNAHHGDVQNPWRPGHVSGGSSSGSAAAVAAGLAAGTLGTDTGGSIRLPAAACGIVGLKPTYGRVSRAGAMPLSWSLDHIGPMTRTVHDAAVMLAIIAGHDPLDATTSHRRVPDYAAALERPVRDLRLGVAENYYTDGLAPEVDAAVREAVRVLGELVHSVRAVHVPDPTVQSGIANVLARSESAVIHERVVRERPTISSRRCARRSR
jgi:aspartyl-tRNA(Asn)/glutamyl-tRNA(Gln) amidotransferase subunit A